MTAIQRQRAIWTGFPGAPGVSTFFFVDAAAHQAGLHTFFANIATLLPNDVTITIEANGDTIESTTGALTGGWNGIAPAVVNGSGGVSYAAPAGAMVKWETGVILFGHRVRGRTYIVPVPTPYMQSDGSLTSGFLSGFNAAAVALPGAVIGNMLVWTRPRAATPAWTDVRGRVHPARAGRTGASSVVTTASTPDKFVVLRSRRD